MTAARPIEPKCVSRRTEFLSGEVPLAHFFAGATINLTRATADYEPVGSVRTANAARDGAWRIMPKLLAKAERPWALRLLPPFPAVANRVLSLVARDNIAASEIGAIIKIDPTFTAEILRVANSALFGFRREIASGISA